MGLEQKIQSSTKLPIYVCFLYDSFRAYWEIVSNPMHPPAYDVNI